MFGECIRPGRGAARLGRSEDLQQLSFIVIIPVAGTFSFPELLAAPDKAGYPGEVGEITHTGQRTIRRY